jgi:hypothetical protein
VKKNIFYIINLLFFLALYIVITLSEPEEVNWKPSYSILEKSPLGIYILNDLLPELFPRKKIDRIYDSPYAALKEGRLSQGNYIIINNTFNSDEYDVKEIIDFVKKGNFCFIAAEDFNDSLQKELKFSVSPLLHYDKKNVQFTLRLNRKKITYNYNNIITDYYFEKYPSSCRILGRNNKKKPNLILIKKGKGTFLLSTFPFAFTNTALLYSNNEKYAFSILSLLPQQHTTMDEFFTAYGRGARTPLRVILRNDVLRKVYFLSLILLILFILFKARRKQRVIPVIKPPANESLNFIQMIGKLYFQKRNNRDLAGKKILYFYEQIRKAHFINPAEGMSLDDFVQRTGAKKEDVVKLFDLIKIIESSNSAKENDLVLLDSFMYKILNNQ